MQLNEIFPGVILLAVALGGWKLSRLVRERSRFARIVGRVGGISLVVVSLCVLLMYSCAMAFEYRSAPVVSPDGKHSARITELNAGAMDSFHTQVELSSRWRVYPVVVFRSENHPKDVEVRWGDNSHLMVQYAFSADYNPYAQCSTMANNITITCESRPLGVSPGTTAPASR